MPLDSILVSAGICFVFAFFAAGGRVVDIPLAFAPGYEKVGP